MLFLSKFTSIIAYTKPGVGQYETMNEGISSRNQGSHSKKSSLNMPSLLKSSTAVPPNEINFA